MFKNLTKSEVWLSILCLVVITFLLIYFLVFVLLELAGFDPIDLGGLFVILDLFGAGAGIILATVMFFLSVRVFNEVKESLFKKQITYKNLVMMGFVVYGILHMIRSLLGFVLIMLAVPSPDPTPEIIEVFVYFCIHIFPMIILVVGFIVMILYILFQIKTYKQIANLD